MVAGCGAAQLVPANALRGAALSPAAKPSTSYVYTCQNGIVYDCLIYAKGKLVATIEKNVKGLLGVAAGKDGLFYVANESANDVLVYSAGGKKLLQTLADGSNVPAAVAVYSDQVAVSNKATLTFFAKGAKTPTRTLKDSNAVKGVGAAFDSKGNCYWSFVNKKSAAQVDEFKACNGKPANLNISPGSPSGIGFDGQGNLYYASRSSSGTGVYKCSGVSSCTLTYSQFIAPQSLNFSKGFADLWVDDTGNYQSAAALYEIDVSTGKIVTTISSGISFFDPPTGIAAGPGPL